MQELIDRALDAAERSGASYADIRLVERESESLTVKNGALESAEAPGKPLRDRYRCHSAARFASE